MKRNLSPTYKGYFIKRFTIVSAFSLLIFLGVYILGVSLLVNQQRIIVKEDQKRKVISEKNLLEHLLDEAVLDLRVMTDSRMFKSFFSKSATNNPNRSHFEDLMRDLLTEKKNYYQIRFLDSLGMEIFRVDRVNDEPHVCNQDELQDKSQRYYFQEAIGLEAGGIYISPFDLNIEHRQIEKPFRPMIRICIPVFKGGHKAVGVNVLNFDGTRMLEELNEETVTGLGNSYLVNQVGYFLNAPDSALEWGFMFQNKKHITIKTLFDEDYEQISTLDFGQFESRRGLFTIATANPFAKLGEHVFDDVYPKSYSWKVISFIPRSELSLSAFGFLEKVVLLFILTSIVGIFLVYLYANAWARKQQAQVDLAESEKHLRLANQTKDRFFSMLSHDLKNASGTIAYYLEFMKEQYETFSEDEKKMHLKDVSEAALQHNRLLYEILDWAKLQQGRTEFKPINILVEDMLEEQKSMVELALKKKGIELELDVEKDTQLFGDLEMIKTIFRNLINNAIKFSHRDSKIQLIARQKAEQVEVRVIDFGVGMREQDAGKILDLDSKIQQKGTENEGGTGFGLKMVAELVQKNDGQIHVESELGKGSSFIVSFSSGK
ncbi:sensor histidine kinase [Sunxiuqinia sp. A32]|uniref:sensor histidine kinase n=1 Tax=Sunxiuqinia sp. A32 TaxID=3461496 RepID=UPI004045755B